MGDTTPKPDLEPGTVLDERYELTGEIARGGFGMVYRARQLNMNREVAIKTIPPEFLRHPDVVERFKREAKLASRLSHPNTVTVHDYGQHEDTLFLVMEFLEGEDLADVLAREASLPIDEVTHIARQVLKSLREAHEYSIVHRDLKPENIFLCEIGGESDFVKVVDFGIAKLAAPGADPDPDRATARRLTVEGNTVGTPTYMSPEQAAGGEVDARSDLYALGVIIYEMVCGHPPFEDDDPAALMRKHIFDEVPDFDNGNLQGGWLESVVMRALAKEKGARFPDAPSFLEAIDQAGEWDGPTAEQTSVQKEADANAGDRGGFDAPEPRSGDTNTPEATRRHTPARPEFVDADTMEPVDPDERDPESSSVITVLEPSQKQDIILLDRPKERPGDAERPRPSADSSTPDQRRRASDSPSAPVQAKPPQSRGSDSTPDDLEASSTGPGQSSADTETPNPGSSPPDSSVSAGPTEQDWSWGELDADDRTDFDDALVESNSSSGIGVLVVILIVLAAAASIGAYALGVV